MLQTGKRYFGRITINPRPIKGGLDFIRSWFKGKFSSDTNVTFVSADAAPWQTNILQEPVPGTVPLGAVMASDPRGATVWFNGVWVGAETNPMSIQKESTGREVYLIHDMIESDSNKWIIKNGGLYQEQESYWGVEIGVEETEKEAEAPILSVPSMSSVSSVFEFFLEEDKWYTGTIKASSNDVNVDNALQSLGFYGSKVNRIIHKGQEVDFEGQWKLTTGNYSPKTSQYRITSVSSKTDISQLMPGKRGDPAKKGETPAESEETFQPGQRPLRPEFEDTGYRGEQQGTKNEPEAPKDNNAVLWILGILGVSVAGYLALKDKK